MNKPVDNLREIKYDFKLFSKNIIKRKAEELGCAFSGRAINIMSCHKCVAIGELLQHNVAFNNWIILLRIFFVVTMTNFMSLVVALVFLLLLSWFLMFSDTKAAIVFYLSTFNEF
jgi:hypothetical protein